MPRRGLEQHISALLDQAPGADQNQRPDEHGYERIRHYPAGRQYDDAGDERAHRPQQIAQDVEVRAPLVERVFMPAVQYDDGREIRCEADRRVAGRCAIHAATSARPSAATSASMCAASASSASEPESHPPISSTSMTMAVMTSASVRRRRVSTLIGAR